MENLITWKDSCSLRCILSSPLLVSFSLSHRFHDHLDWPSRSLQRSLGVIKHFLSSHSKRIPLFHTLAELAFSIGGNFLKETRRNGHRKSGKCGGGEGTKSFTWPVHSSGHPFIFFAVSAFNAAIYLNFVFWIFLFDLFMPTIYPTCMQAYIFVYSGVWSGGSVVGILGRVECVKVAFAGAFRYFRSHRLPIYYNVVLSGMTQNGWNAWKFTSPFDGQGPISQTPWDGNAYCRYFSRMIQIAISSSQ